jgi:hypothetical protein
VQGNVSRSVGVPVALEKIERARHAAKLIRFPVLKRDDPSRSVM